MDPSALIERLSSFSADALSKDLVARKEALGISRLLTSSLQESVSEATELVFTPFAAMAARIAVDLDLFRLIVEAKQPQTSAELAERSSGEALLISRILRALGGIGFVYEVSEDTWAQTPTTQAMAKPTVAAGHRFVWDFIVTTAIKTPQYLRETKHKIPTETTSGFAQYAHGSKLETFDLICSKPDILRNFNLFMGNTMGSRSHWVDWFPVEERLLDGADPGKALLVDVGGGKGHDLQAFHTKWPNLRGLVLQDLPQALDAISQQDLDVIVERMHHDFFTEQPVKGARAYFLHHILHDWPEKYCLNILAHLHDAMEPGYSKLLIHELVLPDQGASAFQAIFDMTMMNFNNGMERSRSQWRGLLEKAGFEMVQFWVGDDDDADGIIEAVRAHADE